MSRVTDERAISRDHVRDSAAPNTAVDTLSRAPWTVTEKGIWSIHDIFNPRIRSTFECVAKSSYTVFNPTCRIWLGSGGFLGRLYQLP